MLVLDKSILNKVCLPVNFSRPRDNLRLAQQLYQTMRQESGIGLAANQVGIDARLFVMFVDRRVYHCFNPEIITASEQCSTQNEGCLSFPKEFISIARPERILVKYQDAYGNQNECWLLGLAARCFQHELDHLNGITMHERQIGVNSAAGGDPYKIESIGLNSVLPTK